MAKHERRAAHIRARVADGKTLRDHLASSIRKAITDGIYAPGEPLGEEELAGRFGVSRGPVREAIIQLQKEYLVRSYPNRGSFVYQLSEDEFDQVLELRSVLEPAAMEYARMDFNGQIETLKGLFRELQHVALAGNFEEFADKDLEFHKAVWTLSGRSMLKDLLTQICQPLFVFFKINSGKYLRAGINLEAVAQTHQLMVDYLDGKTELSARECFRPVIEETQQQEKPVILGGR
jgi:DNA-binding GntR family transcriptional regulator